MDSKYREKLGLGNKILTDDEIQIIVEEKAKEMFKICDREEKGFVTKRDMQHLVGTLPLDADQLEEVFDLLDDDGNQYMTLEEFNEGFGGYLGVQFKAMQQAMLESEDYVEAENAEENLEHEYSRTMKNLGAHGVFDEQEQVVKELWKNLKKNEPELLGFFEDFVHRASSDIKKAQSSAGELENALRTRTLAHENEVHRLYEEMETQIKSERERILQEERSREKRIKEELTTQVRSKEDQLQELMRRQTEMEDKLKVLTVAEQEAREANEELEQSNYELKSELDNSKYDLKESKGYLSEVQGQIKKEKRERAQVAFKVTAGIVQERESLVKQLEMLRDMNKKLQDERDEYLSRQKEEAEREALAHLARQGSVLSSYSDSSECNNNVQSPVRSRSNSYSRMSFDSTHRMSFDNTHRMSFDTQMSANLRHHRRGASRASITTDDGSVSINGIEDEDDIEVDDNFLLNQGLFPGRNESSLADELGGTPTRLGEGDEEVASLENELAGSDQTDFSASAMRGEPVGAHTSDPMTDSQQIVATNNAPERLFKVVFVGDSGVGKTSFIHRFCTNTFQANFSATIGVDFQVKSMAVNNQLVALQLWDTAGQERFRSITRHYFRKADGVIVMYDITSEQSFVNVRNWMSSVEEATEENVVRMIIGNKTDLLLEDPGCRVIKQEVGKSLAEVYQSLFIETSAKTGDNVKQAFNDMARLLWEKEDQDIEKALNLTESAEKKGCCS